jgi:hypothetical protein
MNRIWKRVVFSCEFGEDGICPECGEQDGECQCPGPHSETDDGTPYEFKEVDGVLYAQPPNGYTYTD